MVTALALISPAEPTPAEVADLCDKAADVVDKNGLHKGYLYDDSPSDETIPIADRPIDAVGAINIAAYGTPRFPAIDEDWSPAANAAELALSLHLKKSTGSETSISEWCDAKPRQKRHVVKALHDAAAALRGGA